MNNNKFTFDDRKKELHHNTSDEMPLFNDKKYGTVVSNTEVISGEEGTVRIMMFLEGNEKGIKAEIEGLGKQKVSVEEQIELKKKDLRRVSKELKQAKDAVGTRINFKKIRKEIKEKEEAKAKKDKAKEPKEKKK